MKPSERRALKAQKEQTPEMEQSANQDVTVSEGNEETSGGYVRKEGFFQSHVRLITFIITVIVVIGVLSPFGVDMLVSSLKDKAETDKKDISLEAVCYISDNPGEITWSSFDGFNYTDYSRDDGKYFVREYPIKNSELVLKVGGLKMSGNPDYIYLISYTTGEHINILKEDARAFIAKFQTD